MLIIINYNDSEFKEEAQRLINKLCEGDKNVFVDLTEKVATDSAAIPSLEFAVLKNLFDTEIPAIEKNVVLDGDVLFTMMDNFDDFQRDFLFKQMNALGHATARLVKEPEEDDDEFGFLYFVGKEFYVDFEKKLNKIVKKVEESPLYKLLKGINAYGFYIGTCNLNDPPTRIVSFPGGAGQKITYDEYANWVMSETPIWEIERNKMESPEKKDDEKYAYVRQHHPVELLAKKIAKKGQK